MNTIISERIKEENRTDHTARIFGIHFPMVLEPVIYSITSDLSPEYRGGYWHFYRLSNEGFYMAPDDDAIFTVSCENGFEGTLSADALGIAACLYAYSHLSFGGDPELAELCARQYHLLRDFTMSHDEVRGILSAID